MQVISCDGPVQICSKDDSGAIDSNCSFLCKCLCLEIWCVSGVTTIIEGTILDVHIYFHIIYGEFLQTHEGTDNAIDPRTTDAAGLGPNRNP